MTSRDVKCQMFRQNGGKIAFLIFGIGLGGVTSVSRAMAERFAFFGVESHFICLRYSEDVLRESEYIKIAPVLVSPDENESENREAVVRYVEENNIKILFSVTLSSSFFDGFNPKTRCIVVNWIHSMPLWEYWDGIWVRQVRSEYSFKHWLQWHLLGGKRKYYAKNRLQEYKDLSREDIRKFDRTIVLSPEYVTELAEALQLEPADKAKLISITNTIDIAPSVHPDQKKRVIAFVGRLSIPSKRPDRLLKIWKRVARHLPDWTLRFYGTGSDDWLLREQVKRWRLPRVEFMGFVSEPKDIYPEVDIICLLSPFEGFPMVLIEGQNYGCIPVTFDSYGAARSIVGQDGYAGRLIPAFDLEAYAKALLELCRDDEGRRAMQERCLQKRYDYAPEVNDSTWRTLFDEYL